MSSLRSLSHCAIVKGKIISIITCHCQDLNKVEVVCCSGHFHERIQMGGVTGGPDTTVKKTKI